MNTTSRIAFATLVVAFCSFSAHAQRQTKLYIDDNTGHFSILQATNAGGGGTITFPAGNGTLVTSASSPALGALLYANGAGGWTALTPGTNTYALTLTSGVPAWQPETGFALPYNQTFAPGASTAAFAITNTSTGGYAIEGVDNSSGVGGGVGVRGETTNGIGVVGITTNGTAGVDAASSGTGLGLYCANLGTGGSSNSAIGTYTALGNTQPNILISTFGSGPDIEGTNDSWQVINADLTLGLNGLTKPIAGQLNLLDGTSPGNAGQLFMASGEFGITMSLSSSLTTDNLSISGQETSANGGTGGNINISAGYTLSTTNGTGGNVSIKGGDESGTLHGNGGDVAIFGGFGGTNSGIGGVASLNGGPGGGASTGGAVQVFGGSGGANIIGTGGAGGNSYLVGGGGGNISFGTNGSGGAVVIEGGKPGTGGAGGSTGQIDIQDVGGNTQIGNAAGTVTVIGSPWSVDHLGNGNFTTLTASPSGSANGISIFNSGTGYDITGDLWDVASSGAAIFRSLDMNIAVDPSGHYTFDASGTPDFTVIETHTGQSPFPYVNLPTATAASAGRIVAVKYDDPTPSHVLIVYPAAGQHVDGLNEYDLNGINDGANNPSGITLVSDGANWFIIGSH